MNEATAAGRRFDAIVIGSGIGGLMAALTIAEHGRSVVVLEAGKQLGGYCNPFKRGHYSFDPGLHYIGECGPGQAFSGVLESLGVGDIAFRELSPDGFDRLVFPGYEVKMPRGLEVYRERLARDFPSERAGLYRFFDVVRSFRAAMAAVNGVRDLRSAARLAPHLPFLARFAHATFADVIEPLVRDPLLRAVLAAQGGDYGLPPRRASALVGLGVLDHYLAGAYYPVGGSRALRDALVRHIEKRGGLLLRNHAAARILVERGRAAGVRCAGGEEYRAEVVVSNADATVTYGELLGPEHLSLRLRRKVRAIRHSLGSICLFLGTDLDVSSLGMTDANVWSYPTTDFERAYAPLARGEMPPDGFFFLSSPTLKDPASAKAPPGHHTLEVVTLAPYEPFARWAGTKTMKRGEAYESFKEQVADRLLRDIERFVPGIRGRLTVKEVATPLTNVSFALAPRGAVYGPDHTPGQMGLWRFAPKGALPGLFLCGASTFGAGVVPCAMSGHLAGKLAAAACKGQRASARASTRQAAPAVSESTER